MSTKEKREQRVESKRVVSAVMAEQRARGWTNIQLVTVINAEFHKKYGVALGLVKRVYDNWKGGTNLPRSLGLASLKLAVQALQKT